MILSKTRTHEEPTARYKDIAEFIEFAKVKGVRTFKSKDFEFEFSQGTPIVEAQKYPVTPTMPDDADLLYASSETLEWEKSK